MLFNSYEFIFLFLPITFFVYFLINKARWLNAGKIWLILSSLFFYSWWNPIYLPLILFSLFINFSIGNQIIKNQKQSHCRQILTLGIILNLSLLGYFKYADFFIVNINTGLSTEVTLLNLALPLAISFFTFQQIAYLVDSYRGETTEYNFLNYALFVTFFPQLIAGPIVHHKEMMPQFASLRTKLPQFKNIGLGLFIFSMGLFKKVIIADTFAGWVTPAFDEATSLSFIEAWSASLSYTFQLYFDFSGYTDMAIGAALLFNIRLPINFNSPYKALSVQDFWRRWHMTLSRFLRDYVYIPLGGNRGTWILTYRNLLTTFLLGGLWHGAGWTFVFWGLLHGLALCVNHTWKKLNIILPKWLAWFLTFNFINITWVFFRAETFTDATKVLTGMLGFSGFTIHPRLAPILEKFSNTKLPYDQWNYFLNPIKGVFYLSIAFITVLLLKNSIELMKKHQPNMQHFLYMSVLSLSSLSMMNIVSEFLYFNF